MAKALYDISVHVLGQTILNDSQVEVWLKEMGVSDEYCNNIPYASIPDGALLTGLAAKQCYMSFEPGLNPNVTKVRKDWVEYLDNVLKSGHGSVLEHSWFTFGINGCSRVFTAELNRHGDGSAISERSMRYIKMDDLSFWMPQCFRDVEGDPMYIQHKKGDSRQIMQQMFVAMEASIRGLSGIWEKELAPESSFHQKKELTSAFRRIIGMGVATGGVWSFNLRALRHILALRTSPGAEEEIAYVFTKIGKIMLAEMAPIFADFKIENGAFLPAYHKV
jgi:thymidylate synthase (FAD)